MYHAAWGTQPLRGWLTVRKGLGEESVAAMRRSAARVRGARAWTIRRRNGSHTNRLLSGCTCQQGGARAGYAWRLATAGVRQTGDNGVVAAVRFQRLQQIALRHQHVANKIARHRQVALPAGVAGVGLRQT